jgi:hypothetical protein
VRPYPAIGRNRLTAVSHHEPASRPDEVCPSHDQQARKHGSSKARLGQLARRYYTTPYLLVSCCVLLLIVGQTINGRWQGDFWLHSAVVRELEEHPFHPDHPLFAAHKPHVLFSPYALAVSLVGNVMRMDPVSALAIAGLLNVALLLFALPFFVRVFSSHAHTATYVLILTLFFWGWHPWTYSGFFHLNVLGSVSPYPSTFATGLAFLLLAIFNAYIQKPRIPLLIPVFAGASLVVLTHIIVAFFLYTAMLAIAFRPEARRSGQALLVAGVICIGSLALTAAWPYYSLFDLVSDNASRYNESHVALYRSVLLRGFPLVLAVPIIASRWRRNRRDPLVSALALLILAYAYGGATGNYNFGRVIAYMALLAHVALGDFLASRAPSIISALKSRRVKIGSVSALTLFAMFAVVNMSHGLARSIPRGLLPERYRGDAKPYASYSALFRGTPRSAVTMATLPLARGVPTFGGKIVGSVFPSSFVSDDDERRADVRRFFASGTTSKERERILEHFHVRYLLIETSDPNERKIAQRFGQVQRVEGDLALIRVRA